MMDIKELISNFNEEAGTIVEMGRFPSEIIVAMAILEVAKKLEKIYLRLDDIYEVLEDK